MHLSRPALVGYVALVLLMITAFWLQSQLADQLEREGIIRAYNLCINQNETREILKVIIEDARDTVLERKAEGRLTPEEVDRLDETLDFYGRAIDRLQFETCPAPPPDLQIEEVTPIQPPSTQ